MCNPFRMFKIGQRVWHPAFGSGCVAKWNGAFSHVAFEGGDVNEVKCTSDLEGSVIWFDDFPPEVLLKEGFYTVKQVKVFPRRGDWELRLENTETFEILKVRTRCSSFPVARAFSNEFLSEKPDPVHLPKRIPA